MSTLYTLSLYIYYPGINLVNHDYTWAIFYAQRPALYTIFHTCSHGALKLPLLWNSDPFTIKTNYLLVEHSCARTPIDFWMQAPFNIIILKSIFNFSVEVDDLRFFCVTFNLLAMALSVNLVRLSSLNLWILFEFTSQSKLALYNYITTCICILILNIEIDCELLGLQYWPPLVETSAFSPLTICLFISSYNYGL